VPARLIPTAAEQVILAVGSFDDLAVPIIPLLHGRVFQAVFRVARPDRCRAPDVCGQRTDDWRWQKIINERLVRFGFLRSAKVRCHDGLNAALLSATLGTQFKP
jgi:hypothetical protein